MWCQKINSKLEQLISKEEIKQQRRKKTLCLSCQNITHISTWSAVRAPSSWSADAPAQKAQKTFKNGTATCQPTQKKRLKTAPKDR